MLNILVVGGGSREHTIVWKLLQSREVNQIFVAPGNAGTMLLARNLEIQPVEIQGIVQAAQDHGIHLVIVGPEAPLAAGLVDALEAKGIPAFGPNKAAAILESSKAFSKDLLHKYNIPCASSVVFTSYEDARRYVDSQELPIVIKADGLAAGKGVTIATTQDEAYRALHEAMIDRVFGEAGERIIVEEFLEGREVSLLAFTDGKTVAPMVPACDYKRVFDNDEGPNTGGMGCYSPPQDFGQDKIDYVKSQILEPTVRAMAAEGRPYKGVLYAGLIETKDGIKVLEFNARFGDPETQVILPRLESDLIDIAFAVVNGRLDEIKLRWSSQSCIGVVVASGGYPGAYDNGYEITGLGDLDPGVQVFHAGTSLQPVLVRDTSRGKLSSPSVDELIGSLRTAGGRVLTVVALGETLREAREKVYRNLPKIHFQGAHYRTDIAAREII